jgi:preprotein translocase subunit SecG
MNVTFFIVIAILAVAVVMVPIVLMTRAEHRELHGSAEERPRRFRNRKVPVADKLAVYTQTSEPEFQDKL